MADDDMIDVVPTASSVLEQEAFIVLPSGRRYILHPQAVALLRQIASGAQQRTVVTIFGRGGAGKYALLQCYCQWAAIEPSVIGSGRVVGIRLRRTDRAKFRQNVVFSPMTVATGGRLWHALQRMSLPSYMQSRKDDDEDTLRNHGEAELWRMQERIERLIRSQHVVVICIDNGECLDELAVDWLIDLRETFDEQLGLVVCVGLEQHEQPGLSKFKHIARLRDETGSLVPPLVLNEISSSEFEAYVLPRVLKSLGAQVAPDIRAKAGEFVDLWWQWTEGNWRAISRMATACHEELGPGKQRPRLITQEVMNRVITRLTARHGPSNGQEESGNGF